MATIDWGAFVRRDDLVVFGEGAGEPLGLTRSLVRSASALGGIRVFAGLLLSDSLDGADLNAVQVYSYGAYGKLSELHRRGMVSVVPGHYARVPDYLCSEGPLAADVALIHVSPANRRGQHSLGVTLSHTKRVMAAARYVVAQVNPRMPWTEGDSLVSAEHFDRTVEVDDPLIEMPPRDPSAAEREIAIHVARLVPNRAVIQLGIGALPDAIAAQLARKRDLGIHSGMLTDSFRRLVEAGAVTNRFKEVDTDLSVTTFFVGSRSLYEFIHRNESVRMREPGSTHAAEVLGRLRRLHAINSAIEVDLTGQVNAETIGSRYVGQTGGQVDFQRAALSSLGGRGIIALPSTTPNGDRSRIVAQLSGPVTTARSDADTVVTELGIAELRGRTLAERVDAMIAIAHPEHRAALRSSADLPV